MDIWQKMYEKAQALYQHRKSQTLSMLGML